MNLTLTFDGACDPNPGGIATYGFAVYTEDERFAHGYGVAALPGSDAATNNVAEYTGMIRGLERILANGLQDRPLLVRGDSKLVIEQTCARWKVKEPRLRPLAECARELAARFPDIRFEHVPRDENTEADALTGRAKDEFTGTPFDIARCDDPKLLEDSRPEPSRDAEITLAVSANKGSAGVGVVLREGEVDFHSRGSFFAEAGPNQAQYHGLLRALELLGSLGDGRWRMLVYTDNDIVLNQLAGRYRARRALAAVFQDVKAKARGIGPMEATRPPKEFEPTKLAKKLAREALKQKCDVDE